MKPHFTLRPATNHDCGRVQELIFSVLREYGLSPDPATTDADLADIEAYYFDRDGFFGVVEDKGIIVATVGLLKRDNHCCELRKMYALPAVRGQGLGQFLLNSAIDLARQWRCTRMTLETASVLTDALRLYQRYGFMPYHPSEITCRCDIAMELVLDERPKNGGHLREEK